MKTQPTRCRSQPTKAPKGCNPAKVHFGWEEGDGTPIPALVTVSCPSRKTAAALVKWHNLTREEKVERLAKVLAPECGKYAADAAGYVLDLLEGRA
jgi:hypothetical protein